MATQEKEATGTALATMTPPSDEEIQLIRRHGVATVIHNKEVNKIKNQLAGTEWGQGASPMTLAIVAEFCKVIRAHPIYHIDILGGRPYPNANYWSDRLNVSPRFIDFAQVNISKDAAQREHYGVPEWAEFAYETIIRKLVPFAPIERIKNGEITNWLHYVVETREAGWAGGKGRNNGKPDPVGDEHPSKTARTRSLRRTAARSEPAWMAEYEEQIKKAEDALEAEWEEIKPRGRSLPASGPQALTSGSGEPTATSTQNAQPLPVDDRSGTQPSPAPATSDRAGNGNGEPHAASQGFDARAAQQQPFDREDARKAYFASLRDIGVDPAKEGRRTWQLANGLPESVTQWEREHFERAMRVIVHELRGKATEGAKLLGYADAETICAAWGVEPETARDWKELVQNIGAEIDKREAGEPQRRLV